MPVAKLEKLEIVPTGGSLGAEVRGVDLSHPLSTDSVERIRRALLEHCLIYFRGQRISEQDQVNFTSYFGKPVEHVRKQMDRPIKEIFLISNLKKKGIISQSHILGCIQEVFSLTLKGRKNALRTVSRSAPGMLTSASSSALLGW